MNNCAIGVPEEREAYVQFKHHSRKNPLPLVVYADLECYLEKMETEEDSESYLFQRHRPFSVGYYLAFRVNVPDHGPSYKFYRGDDCIEWFIDELAEVVRDAERTLFTKVAPLDMTIEEFERFRKAQSCHLCQKRFVTTEVRVHNHCDRTGRYLGAAHPPCILTY